MSRQAQPRYSLSWDGTRGTTATTDEKSGDLSLPDLQHDTPPSCRRFPRGRVVKKLMSRCMYVCISAGENASDVA